MDTSYLTQQVTTIINQLHGYFDEIGVPSHERDSRESELFAALSETLHNQLKLVASEKHELTEQARQLIKVIRQLEASLDDTKQRDDYDKEDGELKVTYPLLQCVEHLRSKHQTISKLHRERYEQIKKLAEALHSYASHLDPSFLQIKLPPTSPNAKIPPTFDLSPTYVAALDAEFTRVYEEYNKRIVTVQSYAEEIVMLWSELGTPQAQIDSVITKCYRESPEQLGLHQDDLARLKAKRDKLMEEKRTRERRLKELKSTVESLWEKLSVDQADRRAFLAANRGCGMRTINEFEDELARLEEMKRQNLHIFVEDARFKLQSLWDSLYFAEEEMLEFTPAFSDVYSDALLSAHEAEIARLEALKEQRAPTLAMVDKHRELIREREDLNNSSQDASRLMAKGQKGEKRDPGKLLREEKMRKRIARELPKIETELRKILESWEDEYGRPFLVHGERYLDELDAASAPASRAMPMRAKTPCNPPPPASTKSARTAPSASRNATIRGHPPPRAKTPTASIARNPLASSTMGPSSSASSMMKSSVSAFSTSTIGRSSPSKIPSRAPLSNLADGKNSPERRPRPAVVGHDRDDLSSTIKSRMGPPRIPPPKMRDLFTHAPPTPTPSQISVGSDRSASIIRHVDPEDVYDDRGHRSQPSWSSVSTTSRPGSVLQHSQYRAQHAGSQYPSAPPPISRNPSHTSSVMTSHSGNSASENWETYTDATDDEPDAREGYYNKMRSAKRLTPDDDDFASNQSEMQKRYKTHPAGLGIRTAQGGAVMHMTGVREGTAEGSEAAWTETDDGETF